MKAAGRTSPAAVQGHLARSRPTHNADPKRTQSNRWIMGQPGDDLGARIGDVHKRYGLTPRADATIANTVLLTMSPDFFRDRAEDYGTYREDRVKVLEAEATAFLRKTFGARLVSAVLHLDEATPHVQAVVVPVMQGKDGKGFRLSGKDMFNPAALHALQNGWEKRLEPHGIEPRLVGSKTRHVTLKTYYAALDEFALDNPIQRIEIGEPPAKGILESKEAHAARLKDWREAEERRLKDELKDLAVEASRGRLVDMERRTSAELRGRLHEASTGLQVAHRVILEQSETIEVSKDEVARLRKLPLNAVAARLGYTGPVPRGANAIDLVKHAGGLDFPQATTWLAQNFGVEAAATAVRQQAERDLSQGAKADRVWTKGEEVKRREMTKQLDALAAPAYRITVMRQNAEGEKVGQNLGKAPKGLPERFWTAQEVIDRVGELTAANLSGGNVFITPIDDAAHHVLIDDLDAENLAALAAKGHTPAIVLETSPGSHQAVLKVDKRYPKEAVNAWFKDMNREHGDRRIVGLVHPLRLAGFENRKDKHRDEDGKHPWVRLRASVNRFCERSKDVVHRYTLDMAERARTRRVEQERQAQAKLEEDRRSAPSRTRSGPRLG